MSSVATSRRNRSILNAVSTSLASKGSSAILQFVSLPLAARVLGREEFGIYATVSLAVFATGILQLGVGPSLSRGIAAAAAKGDHGRESQLYKSGVLLVAVSALIGLAIAAALISLVPIPVLFGEEFAPHVEKMRPALWLGSILMSAQFLIATTDRVREGYMEAGTVNAWGAAGNLCGAIVVFAGVGFFPSINFLLLAVFGPNLFARLINTIGLWRKRPWLLREKSKPNRATIGELLRDGMAFSATSFCVYLIEYVICALAIGRISGPNDVAVFHVLMSVTTAFSGMLLMIGTPLWAAIVDANSKGDIRWMRLAIRRYRQYLVGISAIAAIVLIGLGPWAVPLLYGADFKVDRQLFLGHAVFLCAIGWRTVNRHLAIGLGLIGKTVRPIMAGLAVGFILGVFGLVHFGLWALFLGMAIGTILLPGWALPQLVKLEASKRTVPVRSFKTVLR